jgi:cytochrome bd ubiquinol oxidase subunit I
VGDLSAKHVAQHQPIKLAAAEGQFRTERGAPLRIGGWPDEKRRSTDYAIEIPGALAFIAFGDASAEVRGLEAFPPDEWPPLVPTHLAFQAMVGSGIAMAGLALFSVGTWLRRRRLSPSRRFLRAVVLCGPLGFVALEAGWLLTEWGRQPWIVRGLMRTAEAVTPVGRLGVPFTLFTLVYLLLGGLVAYLLYRQVREPMLTTAPEPGGGPAVKVSLHVHDT